MEEQRRRCWSHPDLAQGFENHDLRIQESAYFLFADLRIERVVDRPFAESRRRNERRWDQDVDSPRTRTAGQRGKKEGLGLVTK